jgi:ligand-binding sensor domain-containing protein
LDSFEVLSFAARDDEVLFVGTSAGEGSGEVYRSTDNGERWRLLAPEFPGSAVNALVALPGGGVIAGTTDGMFRWRPGRSDWERLATGSRRLRVTSLVSGDHGRLVAGTTTGVLVSENGGDTWKAANGGLSSLRVRAITMTATGDIYVAVGSDGANGRPATSAGAGVFRGRFVDR